MPSFPPRPPDDLATKGNQAVPPPQGCIHELDHRGGPIFVVDLYWVVTSAATLGTSRAVMLAGASGAGEGRL